MSNDPVHDLLDRAFAADQQHVQAPELAASVMGRIRRRQRLRSLLLGGAALVGLAMVMLSAAPAPGMLGDWLHLDLTALLSGTGLSLEAILLNTTPLMAVAVIAAAGWLILLEEDRA